MPYHIDHNQPPYAQDTGWSVNIDTEQSNFVFPKLYTCTTLAKHTQVIGNSNVFPQEIASPTSLSTSLGSGPAAIKAGVGG